LTAGLIYILIEVEVSRHGRWAKAIRRLAEASQKLKRAKNQKGKQRFLAKC